ncbi:hypothetical protein [Brachybacterium avium]|uniref:hypothetical protein n=1 Tax=Brachybacterium avium TaxID=2017485 RepID=UPI0012FDA4E4|nr:hypothetical protein [Brachybacterium avium]
MFTALALCAVGCTAAGEPLPAEGAVAHYDAVAEDLTAELSAQEWVLNPTQRTVREEDGRCRYSPGVWEAEGTLAGVSGDGGWDEIAARLDPVLAEHGFEDLGAPSRSGALYSVSTHDGHGTELVLDEQGRLSLRGTLIDTETCTESALGL